MNIVYLEYNQETTEEEVMQAYLNSVKGVVKIGGSELVMPMVTNVTMFDMPKVRQLGTGMYKWINEFRTARNPSEATMDRFGFRIQRLVKTARKNDMDILVIYDPAENIDLVRDELKKWIRTRKK